jgi:hypothetical protein
VIKAESLSKQRLINILLLLAFLSCYVDSGHDGSEFIIEMEFDMLHFGMAQSPDIVLVIFLLIILVGELLLIIPLFTNDVRKSRTSTGVGITILSLVVLPIFILGMFTVNLHSILSTLPFLCLTGITMVRFKKLKNARMNSL